MDLLTLLMAVKLAPKPLKADVIEGVADWLDDHPEATTTVEDGSITEAKLASALKAKINNTSGLTDDIKEALLECFAHVAWTDAHGQDYLDDLEDALFPSGSSPEPGPTPATLSSITAVYTQDGTVYDTDTLDSLKSDLVVTAVYSDSTRQTVASTDYTLSGTLTEGTSTITVSYGGKTTTFTVTVTEYVPITTTLTWTGSGSDKKSNLIDATAYDAYFTLPFVSGSPNLSTGATVSSLGVKEYVEIFDDSAGSHRIGYYYTDTKQIESGRTVANSPWVPFDTEEIFVPKGYYGKIVLSRSGTDAFPDNSNLLTYLNGNATEAVMR